jgi:hypothetical protein
MDKVYLYKLTVDAGGAPCLSGDILSLAICKPAIRSTAKRGNIILGFAANSLYKDNRLVYMARVTENLDGKNYFSKLSYASRPDCIYKWDGRRFEWKRDSKFHVPSDLAHDLGKAPGYNRANVLISEGAKNFRYFGAECPVDYKHDYPHLKSKVEGLGQGSRINFDSELQEELRLFIDRLWSASSPYRETAVPDTPCRDKCSDADEEFEEGDC